MFLRSPHDVCHLNILANIACSFEQVPACTYRLPWELPSVVEKLGVQNSCSSRSRSRNLLFHFHLRFHLDEFWEFFVDGGGSIHVVLEKQALPARCNFCNFRHGK